MADTQGHLPSRPWSAAVFQIALVELIMLMHNSVMLPVVDGAAMNASIFISGLIYVPVAIVARRQPSALSLAGFSGVSAACGVVGAILWTSVAANPADTTLFLVTDTLFNIGRAWGTILAVLTLSRIPRGDRTMFAALSGIAIGYAVWPLMRSAAEASPLMLSSIMLCTLIASGSACQRDLFARMRHAAPPSDLAPTNPFSFVPISSKLFVCIALFETTFGFSTSVRFGAIENWQYALIAIMFGALMLVWSRAKHFTFDEDAAFHVSALVVVAGFLLMPATAISQGFTSTIIEIGSQCFYALMLSTFASIAARNPAWSLASIPLGFAVSSCSSSVGFAIAQGALAAQDGGHVDAILITSAVLVLVLFAFVWIGLAGFSFRAFFSEIVPAAPTEEREALPGADAGVRAAAALALFAQERGLTAREREIFELLARGHSGKSIMERLTISGNTVKTHTRHIYHKCNVHSQQELIDLVEETIGR